MIDFVILNPGSISTTHLPLAYHLTFTYPPHHSIISIALSSIHNSVLITVQLYTADTRKHGKSYSASSCELPGTKLPTL